MKSAHHLMLNGKRAYDFVVLHGIETATDEYLFSQFRYDQWKQLQGTDESSLDHNVILKDNSTFKKVSEDKKFGTVGAVALDLHGNIAAATSTGGMTNKQYGRIGDSPIIGAGTYANNKTCEISFTGHGEPFNRAFSTNYIRFFKQNNCN